MCSTNTALESIGLRRVEARVVHRETGAVADALSHTHVFEVPCRNGHPSIGERIAAGDHRAEEIVLVVPVAEIAAEGHIEDAANRGARCVVLRCGDKVGAVVCEHASFIRLETTTAVVGPQVALVIDQPTEVASVHIRRGHVRGAHQRGHIAPRACTERVTGPLEIVEYDAPRLRRDDLHLEVVRLVQVVPRQLHFGLRERRHVIEIDTSDLEFNLVRKIALIELPITGRVPVL